jgi:hypothetical protein
MNLTTEEFMSRSLLAWFVCGAIFSVAQSTSSSSNPPNLTGSWQMTLIPAQPSTLPSMEIPGLATFTADGSVIETDGSELATAALHPSTPGHGIWQLANTPVTLFVQYISLVLDPNGALRAKNTTTMFLSMHRQANRFSGTYQTMQTTGRTTKMISSGTVRGQLIPHVQLP